MTKCKKIANIRRVKDKIKMKTGIPAPFHEAFGKTLSDKEVSPGDIIDPQVRHQLTTEYIEHLRGAFAVAENPAADNAAENMAYAVFNKDAPLEQRRQYANHALDIFKTSVIEHAPSFRGFDIQAAAERAEELSAQFVEGIIVFAEASSSPEEKKEDGYKEKIAFLFPEEKTREDQAVTALTLLDVMQPYLVDRILEFDIYDPVHLREQLAEVQADYALMANFQRSAANFLEFASTGRKRKSDAEIADELFNIGPLFAQIGQSFSVKAEKADEDPETQATVANIARAFQEGIAMPSPEQQAYLEEGLPGGLRLEKVFSSAKIAYVAETAYEDKSFATKIKRPGVEQALEANVRTFTVMADILQRYLEAHAGDTGKVEQYALIKDALPYLFTTLQRDMLEEMDFEKERGLQEKGGEVLRRHQGIIVPEVTPDLSDDDHITMELVPGQRIEDLPANPEFLKNMMVLLLEGRRSRFLHGDMHAGNVKALEDDPLGRIVAYDWGKSIELPKGFEKDVVGMMVAILRKNPERMAEAFLKIQDADNPEVPKEEIVRVAEQALNEVIDNESESKRERMAKKSPMERRMQRASDVLVNFGFQMIKEYQSSLDIRYVTYMKSMVSLATIVQAELAKPEYEDKRYRSQTILASAARALREVYGRPKRPSLPGIRNRKGR